MKTLLFLAILLLGQTLADESSIQTTPPTLDPTIPIHLGEVFWAPSKTFITWLPTWLSRSQEWCSKVIESPPGSFFSLSGVDALKINDYFGEHAYITREGKRYAECFITPESVRMGGCERVKDSDSEDGKKFMGTGTLKWSCWVLRGMEGRFGENGKYDSRWKGYMGGEKLTGEASKPTGGMKGAAASSSIMGVFTPGVTGSWQNHK